MPNNISDEEIAEARARGARMRAAGLAATSVSYDAGRRRIVLELSNGNLFGIPVSALPNIAGAADADLATVELLGENIIHLESLDADYSVAGLIHNAFGQAVAARAFGVAGGKATSEAKAAAARANGAKGGRPPRKQFRAAKPSGAAYTVKRDLADRGQPIGKPSGDARPRRKRGKNPGERGRPPFIDAVTACRP